MKLFDQESSFSQAIFNHCRRDDRIGGRVERRCLGCCCFSAWNNFTNGSMAGCSLQGMRGKDSWERGKPFQATSSRASTCPVCRVDASVRSSTSGFLLQNPLPFHRNYLYRLIDLLFNSKQVYSQPKNYYTQGFKIN